MPDLVVNARPIVLRAVLLSFAVPSLAFAQESTTGSIAGRVLDPQGAVVPEASVTLRSGQGARSLATDAHGQFLAPYLTPGVYVVRVERPGFKPLEQRDVRVRLGQRVELDYTLSVGALEELVDVTAAAPVGDARSTTAGGILDSDELLRLPVGRRLTSTLYMVPGVSNSSGTGDANPSIAGASGLDNNYVVDGVNITNVGFGGIGLLRRPGAQVRRGGADGAEELLQQLVPVRLVSLVPAAGELRGFLPGLQRRVQPGALGAVRFPHQRPELHRDRRAASSGIAATSATWARHWARAGCPTTARTSSSSTAPGPGVISASVSASGRARASRSRPWPRTLSEPCLR